MHDGTLSLTCRQKSAGSNSISGSKLHDLPFNLHPITRISHSEEVVFPGRLYDYVLGTRSKFICV
jgi:hypothetical protein